MQQIQDDVLDRKPELPASDKGVARAGFEFNAEHGVCHFVEDLGRRSVENFEAFSAGPLDPGPAGLPYGVVNFVNGPASCARRMPSDV